MNTPFPHLPAGRIAYVRQIDPEALPDPIRTQIPTGAQVWGVHSAEGECIALTQDRRTAFFVARENQLEPVSVH